MSSTASNIKSRLTNKYEATIALCYVMAVLFFVIIGIFSFHIQPLVYKVLSCNAGSLPFCEMDPLVSTYDSSTDTRNLQYSSVLNVKNTKVDQIISFPYYKTDGGSAISNLYIKFSYIATVGTDNVVITIDPDASVNAFNIDLEATGATALTAVTVQVSTSNVITDQMILDVIIYILQYKIGKNLKTSEYAFIDSYANSATQFVYGLFYDGTGIPSIGVTKVDGGTTITSSNSILGFISLNLNKDDFQTHTTTVENANDGFLDIKLQTKIIAANPTLNIAGCSDPGAKPSNPSSHFTFSPSHGLYYPTTSNPDPADPPKPCVKGNTFGADDKPCGYRYINKTDPGSGNGSATPYQINQMYYSHKGGTTEGSGSVKTYYNGYTKGQNSTKLTATYNLADDANQVLTYVQLQDKLFCAGFIPAAGGKEPWLKNNFDNSTSGLVPTGPGTTTDSSTYQFTTHPRLNGNTGGTDTDPALPIKLGFD
jgi:hypothetical protein